MPVRVAIAGSALVACTACSSGSGALSVTAVPGDRSAAKAIAVTVAQQAGCGDLEDFDTAGDATWVYTCQRTDEKAYTISVFASRQARHAWTERHAGEVYLARHSYAIAPGSAPGRAPEPRDLDPFTHADP